MARITEGPITIPDSDTKGTCANCGQTAEVRPYGTRGASYCYTCCRADRTLAQRWVWNTADVQKAGAVLGR